MSPITHTRRYPTLQWILARGSRSGKRAVVFASSPMSPVSCHKIQRMGTTPTLGN